MSFRVRPELKEAMDKAAAETGRSVAQEIEIRLENSFRNAELLPDALGMAFGRHTAGLVLFLGQLSKHVGDVGAGMSFAAGQPIGASEQWLSQPWVRYQVAEALRQFSDELHPPGHALPELAVPHLNQHERETIARTGRRSAEAFLQAVVDPQSNELLGRALKVVRDLWGEGIDERWGPERRERNDAG
jgi:hypothetical protein